MSDTIILLSWNCFSDTPRVKTVSVTFYVSKRKKWQTRFTTSDRGLRGQIESAGKVRSAAGYDSWSRGYQSACQTEGNTLIVHGTHFSLAELCDTLGECGLVFRHVEKNGETIEDEVLHFSST